MARTKLAQRASCSGSAGMMLIQGAGPDEDLPVATRLSARPVARTILFYGAARDVDSTGADAKLLLPRPTEPSQAGLYEVFAGLSFVAGHRLVSDSTGRLRSSCQVHSPNLRPRRPDAVFSSNCSRSDGLQAPAASRRRTCYHPKSGAPASRSGASCRPKGLLNQSLA